jgi:hypothetical protein
LPGQPTPPNQRPRRRPARTCPSPPPHQGTRPAQQRPAAGGRGRKPRRGQLPAGPSIAQATCTSPWVSTPTVTLIGSACAMVVMAVSLPDKGRWLRRPGERTTPRRVGGDRLLSGHVRSAGARRSGDRGPTRQITARHQASETTGQTRATATTGIIAVKRMRPLHAASLTLALLYIVAAQRP